MRSAAQAGVELLALSDHDTVDGVAEAVAAGRDAGVRVVPACECSALDGDVEDLHVLGYLVDHTAPVLLDALAGWREDRAQRADRMAAALEDHGLVLDRTVLDARRAAGLPIGRPHLAQAAFASAADRFADFGKLLEAYLIPGAPAFVRRTRPTVEEVVEVIHAAGGVAVWAHPFWDIEDPAEVLDTLRRFAALGMDGVEAFYATHSAEQTLLLDDAARDLGLLTTGSADFHGHEHPRFNRFRAFGLHGREPRLGPIGEV